jgi:hypothetical protein
MQNEFDAFSTLEQRFREAEHLRLETYPRVVSLIALQRNGERDVIVVRGKD